MRHRSLAQRSEPCIGAVADAPTCHDDIVRSTTTPYLERLRTELAGIEADQAALLDRSTIRNVNPNKSDSSLFVVGAADWGWGPSDADVTAMQMHLAARYSAWFERFRLLFPHPTADVAGSVKEVDDFMRRWTSRPDGWDHSIPRTIDSAKALATSQFATLNGLLDVAAKSGTAELRLVPDTNSLIRNPDLASYARAAQVPNFRVHLFPTVLGELDNLKDRGKAQDLRDQAQAVVRRLKGLRDKGNLAQGVKLTNTITVQAEAREIDVRSVLGWLGGSIPQCPMTDYLLRRSGSRAITPLPP